MKYTIKDLHKHFPNDDACLEYIFHAKYPDAKGYYRVKGRKCFANSKGEQIHPLANTIFNKSSTPLTSWFHAIFLFATSKNGVSAKELERQLGVTYKCAWRMAHQIRKLMEQDSDLLSGTVEVDETYYGKSGKSKYKFKNKKAVLGAVQRGGKVRATTAPNRRLEQVLPFVQSNVEKKSLVVTDEYHGYNRLSHGDYGYQHRRVKHGRGHYTWKGQHTNSIEGFWGQFKRSVRGTHHFVSSRHLQSYLDEFAFRYNHRESQTPIFQVLLHRIAEIR